MAGPLTQGVDAAIAAAQAAAAQVDTATKQSVGEQKAAQEAQDQAARSREAVKGLDVRSAEGMKEWMRILREGNKPNIQERQLTVLERIEQNTADMGGDEPEVADFAPAAGT
jgi:hypothetical protein